MFELYTERARRVIFFARYEASTHGSTTIETEHLLLGLLREDPSLFPAQQRDRIIQRIEEGITKRAKVSTSIDLPLSNECKRILAYANEEAQLLAHKHIGTGHLILGVLREEGCRAESVLREAGIDLQSTRERVVTDPHSPESPFLPRHTGGTLVEGRSSTTHRLEDGTLLVETLQFVGGHVIKVKERFRLSDDGKVVSYSHEVIGPKADQHHTQTFEFGVE